MIFSSEIRRYYSDSMIALVESHQKTIQMRGFYLDRTTGVRNAFQHHGDRPARSESNSYRASHSSRRGAGIRQFNCSFQKNAILQGSCNGSLCKHSVASETFTDIIISSAIGEGASDTVPLAQGSSAVRIVFESKSPNLRVNGQIVDTLTGAVVSSFIYQKIES